MTERGERGTVMLETVIIMPVLMMIIFLLLQVIFVLLAKEMTYYAAYCGARAALVYNPADYNRAGGGVVGEAACTALSWISQSVEGSTPLKIPVSGGEEYEIPRSENVRKQVTVIIRETLFDPESPAAPSELKTAVLPSMKTDYDSGNPSDPYHSELADEELPAMVTVTVRFRCPLLIPVGGRILASAARDPRPNEPISSFEDALLRGAEAENGRGWLYNYLDIEETCSLGKPYNTVTFPLVPEEDVHILTGAQVQ